MNESSDAAVIDDSDISIHSSKKTKLKSKLKRRYKTTETQDEIVDLAKLQVPLQVICLNKLLNNNLIDKKVEEHFSYHNFFPLFKTIRAICQAGYKNKKLVLRLIKLTLDPKYYPKLHLLHNNLREAAFLGDVNAIELLINRGALQRPVYIYNDQNPHYKRPSGYPIFEKDSEQFVSNFALEAAIKRATKMNQVEIVKILIEKLERNLEDEYDILNSGLTYAKTKEMSTVYLAKNGDLNVPYGPNDANCLGNAVIDGNVELIDFLLKNNASPIICDESFAEQDISAVTYALERMENDDPSVKEQGKKIMKKFAHYFSPNEKNVIMHIITSPNITEEIKVEAIALVIQAKKININEQDKEGWTPLMYAVNISLLKIIELLLANDADVSILNEDGDTALNFALSRHRRRNNDYQKIVNLLEEAQISQSDY